MFNNLNEYKNKKCLNLTNKNCWNILEYPAQKLGTEKKSELKKTKK